MGSGVAKPLAFFLVCLFSLFSFSYAILPNVADLGEQGREPVYEAREAQWGLDATLYAFLAMAVVLSAVFIGLAYMASQLFNAPALGAWVKIEVQELVVSAIIVVFLVAMVASINGAVAFSTGEENAYEAAINYLEGTRDLGLLLQEKLLKVGFEINIAAGFSYSTAISITPIKVGGNWSSAPFSGMGGLAGAVGNAVDSVSLTVLLISAQKVFLVFFMSVASIIMPLGIALRTFPITRKMGALLLAAGVGTAVVYPTAIVVSKEIYTAYSPIMKNKVENADAPGVLPHLGRPPTSDLLCNPTVQFIASGFGLGEIGWWLSICSVSCSIHAAVKCAASNIGYAACFAAYFQQCFFVTCKQATDKWYSIGTSAYAVSMGTFAREYLRDADVEGYFEAANDYALPAATEYIMLMLVLFLIPIIFTIVLIRNFAALFGGESQLYGLFKLVG